MPAAATIRREIETALANRISSALTPRPRAIRPVAATGISEVDRILHGGLPIGAITEITGPESSGRTTIALSFLARTTQTGKVCAWVDVSDAFDPTAAAAAGVDLTRILWVRCGVIAQTRHLTPAAVSLPEVCYTPAAIIKGLHGGGHGPHPRTEVKGISTAVASLLQPRCAEPQRRLPNTKEPLPLLVPSSNVAAVQPSRSTAPLARLDQALRVADLLLQAGGFSAIIFDMGSVSPEQALRVPLATWFRYRAAAEKTQSSIILLSQHHCTKSSAGLLLRLTHGEPLGDLSTLYTGASYRAEVARLRFAEPAAAKVVSLRKPPQPADSASWRSCAGWAVHA